MEPAPAHALSCSQVVWRQASATQPQETALSCNWIGGSTHVTGMIGELHSHPLESVPSIQSYPKNGHELVVNIKLSAVSSEGKAGSISDTPGRPKMYRLSKYMDDNVKP